MNSFAAITSVSSTASGGRLAAQTTAEKHGVVRSGRDSDASTSAQGTSTTSVVAERVLVSAAVGAKPPLTLPNQLGEVQQAIRNGNLVPPPTVGLNVQAGFQIKGVDAEDVCQTVEAASLYVQEMVREVENLSTRQVRKEDLQAVRLRLANEFQQHFEEALNTDPRLSLFRQNSAEFVTNFSRAESLLEQGSDAYVGAVRKLLSTGESVTVAMKDVTFACEESPSASGIMEKVKNAVCCEKTHDARVSSAASSNETHILKNISTLLRPGRLTLVLGPPGSSKSSFLKAISGNLFRAPGTAKLSGKLEFNGYDVSTLQNLAAWVSYVHQTDEHQALLTTRETVEFAWKCRREPIFNEAPDDEKFRALKHVEVDMILATLGLTNCKDTYIGDATLKGVSGGEKRRVTLAEKLVTGSPVLALDEISTGLDAAATYDIVAYLSSVAHMLGQTIVIALLQPPPEVIELFDDVICLAEGQIIYHGERAKVQDYFENLGFKLPERMELGDFLQTLPTREGIRLFNKPNAVPPRSAEDFARIWRASPEFKAEEQALNEVLGKKGASLDDSTQLGFISSLFLVTGLALKLRLRQTAQLAAKVFSNVVMGAFFGSLFWQLDGSESYLKSMLLFQIPSFIFSTAFPNVPVLYKQKPVVIKQIDAGFYSPYVFTFAQFLTSIPFIMFDILCFGNIVYWCTGLSGKTETFLTFLGLMVTYAIAVNTAFAVFPFLGAKEDTSIMMAAVFLLMCILNSGLVATPDIVPDSVIWLFWINPLAWILRAVSINEYHSGGAYDANPCTFEILGREIKVNERCGDYFLKMRQIRTEDYWVNACHVFMTGFTFFWLLLSFYAVGKVRFEEDRSKRVSPSAEKNKEEADAELQNGGQSVPLLRRQESVTIPRQQLCVRDLWYTVTLPGGEDVDFLKGVSFFTTPGRSLALMGSSGAGKTTLMDVIAGRKTVGRWRGEILVDDKPKVQSEFVKYAAYVEQFGSHIPSATVLESLQFSAELRLPSSVTAVQKANFIQEQLEILELQDLQHSLCAGLSMEQNKRLTLGVELVANPSIVFADEPTSSLDARAAGFVMRVLGRIAQSGRTVICTIHQPSAEVFLAFDDLLLLKRGGEIAFFGEIGNKASNLIQYFESVPGTTPCPKNANPGTWMLEVLGAGTTGANQTVDAEGNRVDFAAYYRRSSLKRMNDQRLVEILSYHSTSASRYLPDSLSTPARSKLKEFEKTIQSTYVRPQLFQFFMLLQRSFRAYVRTASFTVSRFVVVGMVTLLFSIIFYQQPLRDVADIQSRIILLYFFSVIMAMYNMYTVIPFAMARLPVFYRERATQMYSVLAHVTADSIVEIPFIGIQALFGCGALYLAVGMNPQMDRALYFLLISFCLVYTLTMIGLLFSALLPDALSAQLSAVSVVQILQIFSGVMIPLQDLAKPYRPLYYLSPFKWVTEGTVATQFHGDDGKICAPYGKIATGPLLSRLHLCTSDGSNDLSKVSGLVSTVEEFALGEFLTDFKFDNRWKDLGVIVLWAVVVRILTVLVVTFVNHNKR